MSIEYFEDQAGEWRYRVKGDNGEPMATSEGYRDKADAKRGFEAVQRTIAAINFDHPEQEGVRDLGEQQPRVESGPVRFGGDWPGLWLRGDSCFAYMLALRSLLANKDDAFARAGVDGLVKALEATNVENQP